MRTNKECVTCEYSIKTLRFKTSRYAKRLLPKPVSGLCSYQKSKTFYPATFFLLKTYSSGRDSSNTNLLMGLSSQDTYLTATKPAQPGLL